MSGVLVIDRSGRGHSICDLFERTDKNIKIHYAPGCEAVDNDRITSHQEVVLGDVEGMISLAVREKIDFVFVANTAALDSGFVDRFVAQNIPVIGPDRSASRLETSKSYGKDFCVRNGVPVADYRYFDSADEARDYVNSLNYDVVIKADGLCGGNGSYVCDSKQMALDVIEKVMVEKIHGAAGDRVVIERKLVGTEFSFFALADGKVLRPLPMALDYKRSDDGNVGVNGGGMGSFSPHPFETAGFYEQVREKVLEPLQDGIDNENINYNGVIYIGAMKGENDDIKVLEINVRLGDPEGEVILSRIKSNFADTCNAILNQALSEEVLDFDDVCYCNVVATQGRTQQFSSSGRSKGWYKGWPYGRYGKGYPITGLENIDESRAKVFIGEAMVHPEKGLVSDGGRVIHVVGFGDSHDKAVENAYANIGHVSFNGVRYRTDIGKVYYGEKVISY